MTFWDMMHAWPGLLMRALSALLFTGQIYVIVRMIRLRREPFMIGLALITGMIGTLLFGVMMGGADLSAKDAYVRYLDYDMPVYHWPWWVFLCAEAVWAALLGLFLWDIRRYARRHVTLDTIKEAVDLLPTGICFGDERGEALLTNIRMNDICFALTGQPLNSTQTLWRTVQAWGEAQDGQYLVRTRDDETVLFSRSAVTMNGQNYTQIIASDMTRQARITARLKARNAELWEAQYRIKAYQARAAEMFMEEELLTARTEVHDGLGHLLLMGRYYLDHPDRADEAELLRQMRQASGSLLAEAEEGPAPRDKMDEALRRMSRIGMSAEILGSVPPAGRAREIIGHALGECAANAAKHAGAKRVRLAITEEGSRLCAILTNDGEAPSEPVRETGGLKTLRRMVEDGGGSMTVESAPRFRLILALPRQ